MKNIFILIGLVIFLVNCSDKKEHKEIKENLQESVEKVKDTMHQIVLKGVELGKIYEGETPIFTTLADIEGVIAISLLDDNRVYKMAFLSNKKISAFDVASFKMNVENKYNIKFSENSVYKNHFYNYSNNLYYSYIESYIDSDHYSISFSITDQELQKLKNLKVSSDF